jgi:rubrerythrin
MEARANLDRHLRGSRRVDLTGVEWHRIADHPLTEAEIRCLTYMMDIETHTMVFLRDLLATRAVRDPELTAFLACWAYEELWHGEAIGRFLGQAGVRLDPPGPGPATGWDDAYPSGVARTAWVRRAMGAKGQLRHIGSFLGSAVIRDFPAVHMTWGAVNELSTLRAYRRMADDTAHPVLAVLLGRIARDERRHYTFYRVEAARRLEESPAARRVTRWALDHLWSIVGTGVRPREETDFIVLHLLGDDVGLALAREMDGEIATLPGLAGLDLFERAAAEALVRRDRARPRAGSQSPGPGVGSAAASVPRGRRRTRSPSRGSGGMVPQRSVRS